MGKKGKVGEETDMRNVERENTVRSKSMRQEKRRGYQRKNWKGL